MIQVTIQLGAKWENSVPSSTMAFQLFTIVSLHLIRVTNRKMNWIRQAGIILKLWRTIDMYWLCCVYTHIQHPDSITVQLPWGGKKGVYEQHPHTEQVGDPRVNRALTFLPLCFAVLSPEFWRTQGIYHRDDTRQASLCSIFYEETKELHLSLLMVQFLKCPNPFWGSQ